MCSLLRKVYLKPWFPNPLRHIRAVASNLQLNCASYKTAIFIEEKKSNLCNFPNVATALWPLRGPGGLFWEPLKSKVRIDHNYTNAKHDHSDVIIIWNNVNEMFISSIDLNPLLWGIFFPLLRLTAVITWHRPHRINNNWPLYECHL